MKLLKALALMAAALLLMPFPVSAQTGTPAPPGPQQPVDADEAADEELVPLRIGRVTVTGSAWLDSSAVSGGDEPGDPFDFRRARVGASGNLTRKIGWNVSGELTTKTALRNAFVVFRFTDQFSVRVGQANPPTGLERGTSPLVLELIDRSRLTTQLTYRQDIGVTVSNAQPLQGWLSYAVSIVNGTGLNRLDDNSAKDVAVRLEVTPPAIRGLTFNVSGGTGEQKRGRRTRNGAGIEYDTRAFKLLAEGLRQQDEGLADKHGFIMLAAYRLRPAMVRPYFRMLELAARYQVFTDPAAAAGSLPTGPDEDGAESSLSGFVPRTTRELQAGGSYYVNRNIRIMANVVIPTDARVSPDATLLARLQIVF